MTILPRLAEKIARANARYTLNLQRAFGNLLPKLKRAYGQPARDAADTLSQHVLALQAIARFLNRVGRGARQDWIKNPDAPAATRLIEG
jgi:hypothetical protein